MIRYFIMMITVVIFASSCSSYKVKAPDFIPVNLQPPSLTNPPDFVIESVDLIDRTKPIGQVGDKDIVLMESLMAYFEAETVAELEAKGYRCARYQGPQSNLKFAEQTSNPPLHLRLELQDLALSRHPQRNVFKDTVIGSCKIRGVLFDPYKAVVYQKQFVGLVDTSRLADDLVPSGGGLFSRKGLSSLLSRLLERTVQDFQDHGLDEMIYEHEKYLAYVQQSQEPTTPQVTPPTPPTQQPVTPSPTPSAPVAPPKDQDVEWVW